MEEQILPAVRAIIPREQVLNDVWFQQDGCPAHNTRDVQNLLTEVFNNKVIANRGRVNWPARSPDITPLDFYLWGYVKNEVYEFEPPATIEQLEDRVRDVLNNINRNTLRKVTRTVFKKCEKCINKNGRHFE